MFNNNANGANNDYISHNRIMTKLVLKNGKTFEPSDNFSNVMLHFS